MFRNTIARNLKADANILIPIKLVGLRKLVPSHNVSLYTGTSSDRMAWTLSLKYLSVKPRLSMKKGWFLEVESQKFTRGRTHSHHLWLLLVITNTLLRSSLVTSHWQGRVESLLTIFFLVFLHTALYILWPVWLVCLFVCLFVCFFFFLSTVSLLFNLKVIYLWHRLDDSIEDDFERFLS